MKKTWNKRKTTLLLVTLSAVFLILCGIIGAQLTDQAIAVDFTRKNLPPSMGAVFGTDWMGRDMLIRTLTGLSVSIRIGVLTAAVSAVIAGLLGIMAATMGKIADTLILGMIDLVMGIPHILLLILISYACKRGFWGVVIGISLTHWTSLARLIRAEVLQLKESTYIQAAKKLGMGRWKIIWKHMVPHLLPQFLVGLILLFPHAILHEASITFLGFGLPPEQPAIGIILSESITYLAMGKWWLALLPGLLLVFVVMLFDFIGRSLNQCLDPSSTHQ